MFSPESCLRLFCCQRIPNPFDDSLLASHPCRVMNARLRLSTTLRLLGVQASKELAKPLIKATPNMRKISLPPVNVPRFSMFMDAVYLRNAR